MKENYDFPQKMTDKGTTIHGSSCLPHCVGMLVQLCEGKVKQGWTGRYGLGRQGFTHFMKDIG